METRWHYLEGGQNVGPVSAKDIIRRVQVAGDQPLYVWTEGMSDWSDARAMPEFSPEFSPGSLSKSAPGFSAPSTDGHRTLAARARRELVNYLAVSAYLLVWFSALLFYKATILGSVGVAFAPFGFAAVKALILGKFMLVLEALKVGERRSGNATLVVAIVWKALLFTILLFLLSIVEEMILGYFHGREMKEVLGAVGGGTLPQAGATAILMFLVLLPYLAFQRLARTFGDLPQVLMTRGAPQAHGEPADPSRQPV